VNSLKTSGDFRIDGIASLSAGECGLILYFPGYGYRRVMFGATDSAGSGYRQLLIFN